MYRRVSEQGKYWDNFALLVKWANMSDEISPISGRLYPIVSLDPTISELVTWSGFCTKCICNQCVCCSEQVLCKWILQWWSAFLQKWQFAILVKFSSMQFNCSLMTKPNRRKNFYYFCLISGFHFWLTENERILTKGKNFGLNKVFVQRVKVGLYSRTMGWVSVILTRMGHRGL